MSSVTNRINLDAIINDIKAEIVEDNISYYPRTIVKGDSYVRLSDFKFDMISTVFIRFLDRFCNERDLDWFISLDSKSVIIG